MYDIFGKFGAVRQIRLYENLHQRLLANQYSFWHRGKADNAKTRGSAFIVYEDIQDAATAQSKLTGASV